MDLLCIGCLKSPSEIDEYIEYGAANDMTPEDYVREEEGTLNIRNGHFLCTSCYIKAGMPTSPNGWKAP